MFSWSNLRRAPLDTLQDSSPGPVTRSQRLGAGRLREGFRLAPGGFVTPLPADRHGATPPA